jgi:hypothetical protein
VLLTIILPDEAGTRCTKLHSRVPFYTFLPAVSWHNSPMSSLLLTNLPYNASDREIREWIESRGILTKSIRVLRDLVTGLSPALVHVVLKGSIESSEDNVLRTGS